LTEHGECSQIRLPANKVRRQIIAYLLKCPVCRLLHGAKGNPCELSQRTGTWNELWRVFEVNLGASIAGVPAIMF
jgi:hypothetical protein